MRKIILFIAVILNAKIIGCGDLKDYGLTIIPIFRIKRTKTHSFIFKIKVLFSLCGKNN